jgi:hypothetical protein
MDAAPTPPPSLRLQEKNFPRPLIQNHKVIENNEIPACLDMASPQRRKGLRRKRKACICLERGRECNPGPSGWTEFTIMMECML